MKNISICHIFIIIMREKIELIMRNKGNERPFEFGRDLVDIYIYI